MRKIRVRFWGWGSLDVEWVIVLSFVKILVAIVNAYVFLLVPSLAIKGLIVGALLCDALLPIATYIIRNGQIHVVRDWIATLWLFVDGLRFFAGVKFALGGNKELSALLVEIANGIVVGIVVLIGIGKGIIRVRKQLLF